MNNVNSQIEVLNVRELSDGIENWQTRDHEDQSNPNPFRFFHSHLRGKYLLAITLALIGLVAGMYIGYQVPSLKYRSTGLVRVKIVTPPILYQNDQNGVLPMYDAFVESQVSLLTSRQVIDAAIQNPDWKKLGRDMTPKAVAGFEANLEVSHPRAGEFITVSFVDKDPHAAMIAVRSVIEAYQKLYLVNDTDSAARRLAILEERRVDITRSLKALNERIRETASVYGASLPPEKIAMMDPILEQYLNEKAALENKLDNIRLHLGDQHPSVVKVREMIDAIQSRIQQRLVFSTPQINSLVTSSPIILDPENAANNQPAHPDVPNLSSETAVVPVAQIPQLQPLLAQANELRTYLQETDHRIDQCKVESAGDGRVSVASTGDTPLQPEKDRRRVAAAVGGAGGMFLGFGLILLIGICDPRIKNLADTKRRLLPNQRILGVLPQIHTHSPKPEQVLVAAYCVHKLRALLDIGCTNIDHRVLSITSPTANDGKTSLAFALGCSYATSGERTLLIDFDAIGAGLSVGADHTPHRKIGQLLCEEGLINKAQVDECLSIARASNRQIGQVLVSRGYVQPANLDRLLNLQNDTEVGWLDVLAGEPLDDCVVATPMQRLFVLPLGSAGPHHAGQLSTKSVQYIIAEARKRFDIIIIDTGPITGSLEASIVTAEADLVLLTISRGTHRRIVDQSIRSLSDAKIPLAGVVFNRASRVDVKSSTSAFHGRSSSSRQLLNIKPSPDIKISRLGPLASAVSSATFERMN